MKIVHLNTLDTGGAATAAYRIHTCLRAAGVDSKMVVLHKTSPDDTVLSLLGADAGPQTVQGLFRRWNGLLSQYPRRPKGLELFSDVHSPIDLETCEEVIDADILHLHWVAGLFNPSNFSRICTGKHLVWTLHDMNPFTGGCHYAGKCLQYTRECGDCPQLAAGLDEDMSRKNWRIKADCYANLDLRLAAPSRWLGDCIGRSGMLAHFPLSVIPYGLPLENFNAVPDPGFRRRWNIPARTRIILFGADDTSNPRKGLPYLIQAINLLDPRKHNPENLCFVVFGSFFRLPLKKVPYKIIPVGRIENQQKLAGLYASADLFVLPSLEDNLPNTAIEAMACGTPVVAFDAGGSSDIIDHKQTGYLAPTGSPQHLAEGIDWVLCALDKGTVFRGLCRNAAEAKFSSRKQAENYLRLYESFGHGARAGKTNRSQPESAWPSLTVVTPSFNQARYLETCIRSVLDQDYPCLEYIIMDGGSTDGSRQIIEKYAHRLTYWQSCPDAGHYWAIKEGFRRGSGQIMTWLNSDDQFHPGALKAAAAIFRQRPEVEWITGRPSVLKADKKELFVLPQLPLWSRRRYLEKRYHHPFIQQEGTFWRRRLWQRSNEPLPTDRPLAGDLALWTAFFRQAQLYSVDMPLAAYRLHGRNRGGAHLDVYLQEADRIIESEIELLKKEQPLFLPPPPLPVTRLQIEGYLSDLSAVPEKELPAEGKPLEAGRPLVSAIVSTFNSERFIQGCLEDLLAQTIAEHLEIIVIDSASEQNEAAVVRAFQARYPLIRYLRTAQRESVYGAWNRGIKLAQGTYVTNANTDDRHRPDAFEKMVAVLEADPRTVLVYADVIKTVTPNQTMAVCTPTGVLSWFDWQRERLLTRGCFIGPQPMWRRDVHEVFGFFDERMTVAGDYEFWLRISQLFDFRRIPEPLGLYLEHAQSVEHAHRDAKRAETRMIHQRYTVAAAEGKILSCAPLDRMRQGFQNGQREVMRQAVTDLQRLSQAAPEGSAHGVQAQCRELTAMLKHDAVVTEDRIEQFINEVSRSLLTRGAAPCAAAMPVSDREGVPMMQFADKIQKGVRCLLDGGHIETAQWVLDKLLAEFPGHAAAHHERAMLAHGQGDGQRAELHFTRAVALEPGNPIFQKSLGDFYYVALNQLEPALVQFKKVLALSPDDLETLLITGHLCTASRRFDEAQKYYQKVLQLSPDHPDIRQMLHRLAMMKPAQQPTVAPEALYKDACRQIEQGQRQEAARTLEKVIASDPANALAYNDLGVLAFENGDKDKALVLYEKACELAPHNGVFQKNLGDFYYLERGDAQKALARYVQALTLDPQDVESLMAIGHICMNLGRLEDARVFFNRTLEIEPWHSEAQQCLGRLDASCETVGHTAPDQDLYAAAQNQAAAGDLQGAIQTLEQLVATQPNHARACNDLGVLSYEQGQKDAALRYYEHAVRLAPHDPTFLKNLADFYFVEQGRTQEALRIYIQILESNREDVESLMAAGAICATLSKNDDARTFFERILEIEPWNADARERLNRLQQEALGNYGAHIASLGQKRA